MFYPEKGILDSTPLAPTFKGLRVYEERVILTRDTLVDILEAELSVSKIMKPSEGHGYAYFFKANRSPAARRIMASHLARAICEKVSERA